MKLSFFSVMLVGAGGFAGAVARYLVGQLAERWWSFSFPWPTLAINVAGSFLLGVVLQLVLRGVLPDGWRLAAGIGFLGAFTTFSSFAWEVVRLLHEGRNRDALFYVAASCLFSIVAALLGASAAGLRPR